MVKTSVLSINNVHIKMTNYHKHAMFKMKTDKHPYSNTNKGSIQDLKFTTTSSSNNVACYKILVLNYKKDVFETFVQTNFEQDL
jgi:hypothetical protein